MKFVVSILLVFALSAGAIAQTTHSTSSLVIVKLDDASSNQWKTITNQVHKQNQMILEFSCEKSDIVVIRYYHNFLQKADVEQDMINKIKFWGKVSKCKVIHVDLSDESTKC